MTVLIDLLKKINGAASTVEVFSSEAVMGTGYINSEYLDNIISNIDYLHELKAELLTIIDNEENKE